jgi:hypothetical protein
VYEVEQDELFGIYRTHNAKMFAEKFKTIKEGNKRVEVEVAESHGILKDAIQNKLRNV